eukprot:gb/GEZJ01007129.1/.p1 GENE.gb/GEZJ01007129.1/~~gb/GEZJ01007129.1/.p1  ORF type:complete len:289 (-),score=17.35 gb/GEZJ01007129.1/:175-1041(-)
MGSIMCCHDSRVRLQDTAITATRTQKPIPCTIVGAGRIGSWLKTLGSPTQSQEADVVLRRGDNLNRCRNEGPIFVCTRNDALQEVITQCPPHRRQDLVFMQNGDIMPFLQKHGLQHNTRVVLYVAVPSRDPSTVRNGGRTTMTGKWAQALADRLRTGGVEASVVNDDDWTRAYYEKLIWLCSFNIVGAAFGNVDIKALATQYQAVLRPVMTELITLVAKCRGVYLPQQATVNALLAYGLHVGHFATSLSEFNWRNRVFHDMSLRLSAEGEADIAPTHSYFVTMALQHN